MDAPSRFWTRFARARTPAVPGVAVARDDVDLALFLVDAAPVLEACEAVEDGAGAHILLDDM